MNYQTILITGGAGFVGSNLAVKLKTKYPRVNILVMDNLKRRGSELNLPRLKKHGVDFIHGDIRNKEDFTEIKQTDLILECSAEPSVLAGLNSSPDYLINTNFNGTVNCLELARKKQADFVFISTSRVYPIESLNKLNLIEDETRFSLAPNQVTPGVSALGVAEDFPLFGARSLYGTTKLASEMMLQEYIYNFGLKAIINRCGVITGPWQMGKVDQGVFVLWVARHLWGGELSYIGYGGRGKQVRDFLHIDDLFELLDQQINDFKSFSGQIYNVGGGVKNSVSLQELTKVCQQITGKKIKIDAKKKTRPADLKLFITDSSKINKQIGWKPQKNLEITIQEITQWLLTNQTMLQPILS